MSIIERIERLGVQVKASAGRLVLDGNVKASTRDRLAWIRAHKADIIRELCPPLEAVGAERLRPLADQHGFALDALMDWFRDDLEDLARMSERDLTLTMEDMAAHHAAYGGPSPTDTRS